MDRLFVKRNPWGLPAYTLAPEQNAHASATTVLRSDCQSTLSATLSPKVLGILKMPYTRETPLAPIQRRSRTVYPVALYAYNLLLHDQVNMGFPGLQQVIPKYTDLL